MVTPQCTEPLPIYGRCRSATVTRHMAYIAEFTTDIKYVEGKTNFVADALSRSSVSAIDSASVINYKELKHSPSTTLDFQLIKTFDDNLVWCDVSTGRTRPYVTSKFHRQIFTSSHGLGHQLHRATKPLINTRYIWHGINKDV